jgi:hypothetical protein
MNNGEIVEQDRHEQLLRSAGIDAELWAILNGRSWHRKTQKTNRLSAKFLFI